MILLLARGWAANFHSAKALVWAGLVAVDGVVADDPRMPVEPGQAVCGWPLPGVIAKINHADVTAILRRGRPA